MTLLPPHFAAAAACPSCGIQTSCSCVGPCHRMQLFTTARADPFPWGQSFRDSLLQCGSPTGHSPATKPVSVWAGLHWQQPLWSGLSTSCSFPLGTFCISAWVPPWVQRCSLSPVPSVGCRGTLAPPWSPPR